MIRPVDSACGYDCQCRRKSVAIAQVAAEAPSRSHAIGFVRSKPQAGAEPKIWEVFAVAEHLGGGNIIAVARMEHPLA